MGSVVKVQTNFTVGEVNPELRGRIDLQQYESALERARNVLINPRGIIGRRDGLKFVFEIPSAASPASGVRCVPFQFSTTQTYMFVFSGTRAYIFREGTLVTNINSTGNDFLECSSSVGGVTDGITSARLSNLWWAQSADTLLLFEETMQCLKIVRGASHSAWTVSDITFDNIPLYLFTAVETTPGATLTPSATDGNIKLTASAGVFVSGDVGQKIFDNNNGIGLARIVSVVSSTIVEARTETPFFSTDVIASGDWTLQKGWENAWSASRGWPSTATFHEGRLMIAGAKALPSTVWGSKVGFFFDFDPGQALDDEGLEATLDTDQVNACTAIISGRQLQVFTTGTEFTVPQLEGEPITPTSFLFKTATRRGSVEGVRPQMTEGGTLYLQRGGKAIRELIFSDLEASFTSNDISLLSSHLLQSPIRIVQRRGTNIDEGDLLLVLNGGTGGILGSVAAFAILRAQNVVAPSLLNTDGTIEEIGLEDADQPIVYAVVKRTINSATKYYLESFDDDYTTDSAIQFSGGTLPGTTTVTGLGHLEGEVVKVIADDAELADKTVASGQIIIDRVPTTYLEVGLEYPTFTDDLVGNATKTTPLIRTMPVETRLPSGPVTGIKKRIVQVNAVLDDTQNLVINGDPIPFRKLDEAILDSGVAFFTGTKRSGAFLGFDFDGQIEITQDAPLYFTLLALDYRVSVGQ